MLNMEQTSGDLFKKSLQKAYTSDPSIKLNDTTLFDVNQYTQSMKEENLEGGLADNKTLEDIAKKYVTKKSSLEQIMFKLKKQLKKGIKKEMDHTNSVKTAREIAMDHLSEIPNYYDRLKKVEPNEATGSGSSGVFSGPIAFKEQENEFSEEWSEKYKKSIDCSNPKGFSQRAHCQGRKKKETKETTGSGSSGGFSAPIGFKDSEFLRKSFAETPNSPIKEQEEKVEATEATGSGSVGGYSSPSMWAKSTKKKDWGPSRKTQYKGGSFVSVKKKCSKFPYCNQGDIKALNITKNESVQEAIKNVSRKLNLGENIISTILENEYKKLNKRGK
jgi:hypothetical protein